MQRDTVEKLVLRTLLETEMSGYDIHKQISMKGVNVRTNYLYMILGSMQRKGVLSARWVGQASGPRKHLFSLNKKGEQVFQSLAKESVGVLMDAFYHANTTARNLRDHSNAIRAMFERLGIPHPSHGEKLVTAFPSFDPLVCYPIALHAICDAFPHASVFIIKPPSVNLQSNRPSLTLLDGWRHDMPLKDGFADYLVLEGFPNRVSEEDTVSECLRVLGDDGQLIIQHSRVMSDVKKPRFSTFGEFASSLFYDFVDQDRTISVQRVKELLSPQFRKTGHVESSSGNLVIFGLGKKATQYAPDTGRSDSSRALAENLKPSRISSSVEIRSQHVSHP